jgi:formate transporter
MGADTPLPVPPPGHCAGPDMALRALDAGMKKAALAFMPTLVLAVLAGVYIGLGANFFTIVKTGLQGGFGIQQLMGGLAFCLGLILVVVGGAELFTGNTLIVMAWLSGRVSLAQLLRNWAIVYLGNFIGSVVLVVLVVGASQYTLSDNAVGMAAVKIAAGKCSLPFSVVLSRGILCNALVCLAVWLCYSACSTTDKILAIVFPITAFVAGGFEHCVANMYFIPLGMALKDLLPNLDAATVQNLTWHGFLVGNLIPSTIGNIIGGAVMVGGVYWVAYILPKGRPVSSP